MIKKTFFFFQKKIQNWDHSSIAILYYYKPIICTYLTLLVVAGAISRSISREPLSHSELKKSENVVERSKPLVLF